MKLGLSGKKYIVKITDENAQTLITALQEELEKSVELLNTTRASGQTLSGKLKDSVARSAELEQALKNTVRRESYHRKSVDASKDKLKVAEEDCIELRSKLNEAVCELGDKLTSLRLRGDKIRELEDENAQLRRDLADTKLYVAPLENLRNANTALLETYENLTAELSAAKKSEEKAQEGAERARAELSAHVKEARQLKGKLTEKAGIFKNMLDRSFGRVVSSSGKVKSPFSKRSEFDMVLAAYDKHIKTLLSSVGRKGK